MELACNAIVAIIFGLGGMIIGYRIGEKKGAIAGLIIGLIFDILLCVAVPAI